MPVELSSREAFKSLVATLTGKGLDWVVEPIPPRRHWQTSVRRLAET